MWRGILWSITTCKGSKITITPIGKPPQCYQSNRGFIDHIQYNCVQSCLLQKVLKRDGSAIASFSMWTEPRPHGSLPNLFNTRTIFLVWIKTIDWGGGLGMRLTWSHRFEANAICDMTCGEKRGPCGEDGSMKQNQFLSQQCPTCFLVVSVHVSVCKHIQTPVHYSIHTYVRTTNKKIPNGPFSHSWS